VIVQSGDKGQVTDQVTKRSCDIKGKRKEKKMGVEPDHNRSQDQKNHSGALFLRMTLNCTTKSATLEGSPILPNTSTSDEWQHLPRKGMNVASPTIFPTILSLFPDGPTYHHMIHHLTNHLIHAHDLEAHDSSHKHVIQHLILTPNQTHDQAHDTSHNIT